MVSDGKMECPLALLLSNQHSTAKWSVPFYPCLSKTRKDMPLSNYAKLVREHEIALWDWIEGYLDDKRTETARLAKHLNKYRFEFSKHLFDSEIPSTHNYAERTLRGAVLLRKVGCCNRTETGVKAFEILSSLWATFEKRGLHFTEWIKDRLTGFGPKHVPVDIPLGDRDLEFHGDLRFITSIPGIPSVDYVARFTNGQ